MLVHTKPDLSKLPGGWDLNFNVPLKTDSKQIVKNTISDSIFVLNHALDSEEIETLKSIFLNSGIEHPVSVQGRMDFPDDRKGSVRATAWSELISNQLWQKLQSFFEPKTMNDYSETDWWQQGKYKNYKAVGISPMLRFMKYQKDGEHFAHYDAAFIYPNARYRTLMSMVIYLTSHEKSGATRFIEDGQKHLKTWERDHEDWLRPVENHEIKLEIYPKAGNILFFDHRICHDVMKFEGPGDRIIIRGDVIYYAED